MTRDFRNLMLTIREIYAREFVKITAWQNLGSWYARKKYRLFFSHGYTSEHYHKSYLCSTDLVAIIRIILTLMDEKFETRVLLLGGKTMLPSCVLEQHRSYKYKWPGWSVVVLAKLTAGGRVQATFTLMYSCKQRLCRLLRFCILYL